MADRTLASAEQIRELVFKEIHKNDDVMEDGAVVNVGLPQRLQELDADGSNWTMERFGGDARSYSPTMLMQAVANVKARYNLGP